MWFNINIYKWSNKKVSLSGSWINQSNLNWLC